MLLSYRIGGDPLRQQPGLLLPFLEIKAVRDQAAALLPAQEHRAARKGAVGSRGRLKRPFGGEIFLIGESLAFLRDLRTPSPLILLGLRRRTFA